MSAREWNHARQRLFQRRYKEARQATIGLMSVKEKDVAKINEGIKRLAFFLNSDAGKIGLKLLSECDKHIILCRSRKNHGLYVLCGNGLRFINTVPGSEYISTETAIRAFSMNGLRDPLTILPFIEKELDSIAQKVLEALDKE